MYSYDVAKIKFSSRYIIFLKNVRLISEKKGARNKINIERVTGKAVKV